MPDVRLERYPNAVIPIEVIGTDPVRWMAATDEVARLIEDTGAGDLLSVRPTDGYVAPPLTGVWATAPYLHNGSVPTVWHLMHPEHRPIEFEVGGHRLDFEQLGIDGKLDDRGVYRYPREHKPWSQPVVYDTRSLGQSNAGHDFQFVSLSEHEKRALIEYLKLL